MRNACLIAALVLAVLGGSVCAATDLPLPQSAIARLGAPVATSVAASPSDSLVAMATPHGIELRNPGSLELVLRIPDTAKARVVAFSPAGEQLAVLTDEPLGVLKVWDMTRSEVVAVVETGIPAATVLSYSPQRNLLAVSDSYSVAILETESWSEAALLSVENGSGRAVAFSPDSDIVAVGNGNGEIALCSMDSILAEAFNLLDAPTLAASGHVTSLLFSPDGTTLAVGTDESTIELWDIDALERQAILSGCGRTTFPFVFSPDGSLLVTAMDNTGLVELWDMGTYEKPQEFSDVYREQVQSLAYTADAEVFLAVTTAGTIARFKIDHVNGNYLFVFWGPSSSSPVASIAFSPDGRQLAVGSSGGSEILSVLDWSIHHNEFDCGIPPQPHLVCYSPDSLYLVSQYSYLVALTDANTGRSLGSSIPHRSAINDIAVSPAGDVFASAAQDKP